MTPPAGSAALGDQQDKTHSWAVTVERNGDPLVTLSSNGYGGKADLSEADQQTIRTAGEHLLSFVGKSAALGVGDPLKALEQRWRNWVSTCNRKPCSIAMPCEVCQTAVMQMHLAADQLHAALSLAGKDELRDELLKVCREFVRQEVVRRATYATDIGLATAADHALAAIARAEGR